MKPLTQPLPDALRLHCVRGVCGNEISRSRVLRGSPYCSDECRQAIKKAWREWRRSTPCPQCQPKKRPPYSENISDGVRCWYCGKDIGDKPTIDHQHPRIQGGTDEPENLVLACKYCNSQKGGKTVEEYRAYLYRRTRESVIFYGEIEVSNEAQR